MKFPAKYWIPVSAIAFFILIELTLRFAFGLGAPVLVQADPQTGYRFQPNQKVFRFGKKIQYNQYSQRSEPITSEKIPGKLRILVTGDSVLNGGNPTDQSQTITELLETKINSSGQSVEVLNASAGSWGIGNQAGYLREFDLFKADALILQIGTHDLIQPTSKSDVVGHHPAFPNQRPLLAIGDAWTRYAWPRIASQLGINSSGADFANSPTSNNPNEQFKQNMEQLQAIVKLARSQNIPVFVLFTPNRDDLLPPNQPRYKSEFLRLLSSLRVPMIDSHVAWSTLPTQTIQTYYRDYVHLSVPGNIAIADLLFEQLCIRRQLPACVPKTAAADGVSP
jgi:lysophospholipase L1-like esterase